MTDGFNYEKNETPHKILSYKGKINMTSKDAKTQNLFNKILSVFDENHDHCLDSKEIQTIWKNLFHIGEEYTDNNTDGVFSKAELQKLINQNPIFKKMKISVDELIKFLNIIDKTITKSFAPKIAKTNKELLGRLKAKFPQDKYEIKTVSQKKIEIYNKKDKTNVMTCKILADGSYVYSYMKDNQTNRFETYDSEGNLQKYSALEQKDGFSIWEDGDPISDAIYKDITSKTKIGLPTTGKDIEKHIKQITPNNVMDVLDNYENRYGEPLLEAIESEWGLDKNIKERLKNHLQKCIVQSDAWKEIKPNTKLDQDFNQGQTGDCWFLASIAAIKRSSKGQQILNNTIKDNGNGTYTVRFKGADKEYTVSALEIVSKSKYASGDIDVRILEIAANKHYLTGINIGGNPASAFELLLGTGDKWKNLLRCYTTKPNKEKIAELLKNPNMIITAAINPFSKLFGLVMKQVDDKEKYKDDIATAHGYAVVGIDDKNIYLINPWHTDKKVAIPLDVFEDYWGSVQFTEIK